MATTGRGQSHVVGLVLLLGIVLLGVGTAAFVGFEALDQQRSSVDVDAARVAMESAGSELDGVATGGGSTTSIDLQELRGREATIDPNAGSVSVTVTEPDGTVVSDASTSLGAIEYAVDGHHFAYQGGGVFERQGEGSVVVSPPPVDYRSGSEPTLSLPLVTIDGTVSGQTVTASKTGSQSLVPGVDRHVASDHTVTISVTSEYYRAWASWFRDRMGTDAVTVDVATNTVTVTLNRVTTTTTNDDAIASAIRSEGLTGSLSNDALVDSYDSSVAAYPSSAGDDAQVRLDRATEFTNDFQLAGDLHVGAMEGSKKFTNAVSVEGQTITGDGSGGPIEIGSGSTQTYGGTFSTKDDVVSYPYATFEEDVIVGGAVTGWQAETATGSMYVHGDALVQRDTRIEGDLVVGGDLTIHHEYGTKPAVTGDVIYAGSFDDPGNVTVGGNIRHEPGTVSTRLSANEPLDPQVPDTAPVGDLISEKRDAFAQTNDNDDPAADVTADNHTTCSAGASTCTIPAGEYYFENIQPDSGDTVVFDTTGGDVQVYVDDYVDLLSDVTIDVQGQNRVVLFVGSQGASHLALSVSGYAGHGARVTVPGDDADQLWLYARPNATAEVNNYGQFTGVVYGPGDGSDEGIAVKVTDHGQLFGGVVGNLAELSTNSQVHLDELSAPPVSDTTTVTHDPTVRFVSVSANEVTLGG